MSHFVSNLRERIVGLNLHRLARSFVLFGSLALAAGCTPTPGPGPTPTPTPSATPAHLAVAHGNLLTIVDPDTNQTILDVTRYQEVGRLGYRPDGNRLAVALCFGNRVVELEPPGYNELSVAVQAASCPWAVGYSSDNQSLAAMIPFRPNPSASLFGHLWIGGPQPLDRDMGLPLRTFAYRPGGGELAVVTPQGLTVLSTGPGYPAVGTPLSIPLLSIGYTTDGARLIVGTPTGFGVLNAAAGYAQVPGSNVLTGGVTDIAIAPSGGWVALVQGSTVSVRRAPDLGEVTQLTSSTGFRDADFSSDGSLLAIAEQTGQVRRFRVGTWQELPAISISGSINSIAFRPSGFGQRIPVLFVHGHTGNSDEAWFQNANGTSFAAALAANPQLPIDAFYLELPVHGTPNPTRSITDDAEDIRAMIEGGLDTQGRTQVGILNLPAYQSVGRVAIIAYSQGTLSSRYYIKNLMGSRRNGALTVSEFVTLAAPNHGVGDALISCINANEPDRTLRQLCVGQVATARTALAPCGHCLPNTLADFGSNVPGDKTFITELNDNHPLSETCGAVSNPAEAPQSRPARPDGILYVNLMGRGDLLAGDNTQGGDCAGRRLARNLATNADNREFAGLPFPIHLNVPHRWEIICTALRTVTNHQAPLATDPCTLTQP